MKCKKSVFGSVRGNPLAPTCIEEKEALKQAPPWRGAWITKPTIKQRVMLWVNYMTNHIERRDDEIKKY
jgi:hypothetical protein